MVDRGIFPKIQPGHWEGLILVQVCVCVDTMIIHRNDMAPAESLREQIGPREMRVMLPTASWLSLSQARSLKTVEKSIGLVVVLHFIVNPIGGGWVSE